MFRLYAIAGIALAVIVAGAYVVHLQRKASRVDAAEAAQHEAEAKSVALAETFSKAAETNRAIAASLDALRSQQAADSLSFAQALKAKPLVREVIREVNGQPVSCTERDPVRYLELFNRAVSGSPNP